MEIRRGVGIIAPQLYTYLEPGTFTSLLAIGKSIPYVTGYSIMMHAEVAIATLLNIFKSMAL